MGSFLGLLGEVVLLVFDGDVGGGFFVFEPLVAGLEVLPEGEVRVGGVAGEVFGGQAKGEEVDAEEFLAALVGGMAEGVDFFDFLVGHGEAADGDIGSVDHDEAAGALVGLVVGVGVADVEGEVEVALGIHLGGGNEVESFGDLAVAFAEFGAEGAGGAEDGVALEEDEGGVGGGLDPEFEEAFFFEGAEEDGGAPGEVFFGEGGFEGGGDFLGDGGEAFLTVGVIGGGEGEVFGAGAVAEGGEEEKETAEEKEGEDDEGSDFHGLGLGPEEKNAGGLEAGGFPRGEVVELRLGGH